MNDQSDAGNSDNTQLSKETDIHDSVGFETAISASERQRTHALERAATWIGILIPPNYQYVRWQQTYANCCGVTYKCNGAFFVSFTYAVTDFRVLAICVLHN
jgi:hypothetical protein